ncbi:MAG: adenylate/guanylate cyclase domain-containing protein [Acidimicrobiales bacterium]
MSVAVSGAIVFTDIVGFTDVTDQHGDDAAEEILTWQEKIVGSVLPPTGKVIKELGDGLLLWFSNARHAIETSHRLQQCFEEQPVPGIAVWVRIGGHWGKPRWRGDDIIGRDVNLASRITDLAGPGEVLCSAALVHASGPIAGVRFEELGPVFVRGFGEPVLLMRASWEPSDA